MIIAPLSQSTNRSNVERASQIAVAALLAFSALFSLATTSSSPDLTRYVVLGFTAAGAGAAFFVGWRSQDRRRQWRQGWTLIGLAFAARAVHYALVLFLTAQAGQAVPIILRGMVGYVLVLQPILLWLGLLALTRTPSSTERAARAIDSLLLGGSVLALIWWIGIEPMLLAASKANMGYIGWARPFTALGNAAALALALQSALRAKQGSIGLWLMALTLAALTASDFLFFWTIGGADPTICALLAGACPLLLIISALRQLGDARFGLTVPELSESTDAPDALTEPDGEILTDTEDEPIGERWSKSALFPDDTDVNLKEFQESRRELSLRWMTGAVAVVLPAIATLAGIYHLLSPHRVTAPGELWWAPLLVCLAALRHAVVSLRSMQAMGVLLAYASSMQDTIAARTHQLTALHATTADLNNTLNQEQLLTLALDRMLEAVHADAGAVWLRADFQGLAKPNMDMRGMGSLQHDNSIGTITNAAFLRRQSSRATPKRREEGPVSKASGLRERVENGGTEQAPSAPRWRLVRSQGYELATERQTLHRMNEALEKGGLTHCAQTCATETGKGSGHVTAIRWKGEVIGVAGIVCWQDEMAPAERKLLDSLAMEVGAALQNAYLYQEARRRADLDGVTDLLNHRSIQEHLSAELANAREKEQEFTIVMMDLNNFKFFNDTYGHPVGDKVLRIVARCLRETCRTDDVIARYGGDEFVALLPNTDARGALELCSRIAARVEEEAYQDPQGRRIPIGLSFGAAVFPHDGNQALDLLSVADANLYEAKRGGAPLKMQRGGPEETEEIRQLKEMGGGGSFGILDALVTAIDNKDHYTRRHSEDVTHWAVLMARELDYSSDTQRAVRICGLLHDVGKIAMPDAILRKPGRLNDDEFQIMQQHPVFGALIVKDVPNLTDVLGGIRHHHERYDGKGYPDGLKGEDIPLLGRMLAVPDCFSAMTTERPYRKALPWSEAVAEIRKGSGTQFDPAMADVFLELIARTLSDENNRSFDRGGRRQSVVQVGAAGLMGDDPVTEPKEDAEMVARPRSVADAEIRPD